MLDIKKVYVIVFKDDETNHITGDNPRSAPFLAANAMIDDTEGETSLCYWSIGDERGHSLEGKVVQDLKNGIIFHADNIGETLTLTEFTMDEFELRSRPNMERIRPGSTNNLRSIEDVYAWCRSQAPQPH